MFSEYRPQSHIGWPRWPVEKWEIYNRVWAQERQRHLSAQWWGREREKRPMRAEIKERRRCREKWKMERRKGRGKWTNVNLAASHKFRTTIHEVKAWFGIHMLMGLVKINDDKNYWSTHPGLQNRLIATTMKQNRFDVLNQHIACNDPAKDPELIRDKAHRYLTKKRNPLYPLQPLWDKIHRRCLKNYRPNRELAINEAMIRYRGFKADSRWL